MYCDGFEMARPRFHLFGVHPSEDVPNAEGHEEHGD